MTPRPGTSRLSFVLAAAVSAVSTVGLGWLLGAAPCGAWIWETGLRAGVIQ